MQHSRGALWKKLGLVAVMAIVATVGYVQFGESLTLENLAAREAELKALQQEHPLLVYGVAFVIYVVITGLSLPGATVMTLLCGWFFGFWRAFLLVSFASTAGATVAFLVCRYLLREPIQKRFGDRLATFNQALEREGAFYLFMLRMIPAVPFFVINVVMGLTPIAVGTFWWVSQLGMLPATAVYVYAGASVPGLNELAEQGIGGILSPQLWIALALLGVMPLIFRKLLIWYRPASTLAPASEEGRPQEIDHAAHSSE